MGEDGGCNGNAHWGTVAALSGAVEQGHRKTEPFVSDED